MARLGIISLSFDRGRAYDAARTRALRERPHSMRGPQIEPDTLQRRTSWRPHRVTHARARLSVIPPASSGSERLRWRSPLEFPGSFPWGEVTERLKAAVC
jgi:hypothetical protein